MENQKLNEDEHEDFKIAVKTVVYFATRRELNKSEKADLEWLKKMLAQNPA